MEACCILSVNSGAFSEGLWSLLRGKHYTFHVHLVETGEQVETKLLKYSAEEMDMFMEIVPGKLLPTYVI